MVIRTARSVRCCKSIGSTSAPELILRSQSVFEHELNDVRADALHEFCPSRVVAHESFSWRQPLQRVVFTPHILLCSTLS